LQRGERRTVNRQEKIGKEWEQWSGTISQRIPGPGGTGEGMGGGKESRERTAFAQGGLGGFSHVRIVILFPEGEKMAEGKIGSPPPFRD